MSIIFYIIIGFLFWELLHMTVWEWFKKKFKLDEKKISAIFIFIAIALIMAVISSGFYTTTTYEETKVTTFFGNKFIQTNQGIHYSLLGNTEKIDLRKQIISYPNKDFYGMDSLVTKDNQVIRLSAILEYKIKDSHKWAIENKDTEHKLSYYLSSLIVDKTKSNDYSNLMLNQKNIEKNLELELKEIESEYGIEIINFYFSHIIDSIDVINSKSNAEASKIKSQADKKVNDLLQSSLDKYTNEQLDYLKTKLLSENPNLKWVISNTNSGVIIEGES